jgi:hypothetical protein
MALINRPISSLFNGVSQQPPSLRLPSQGELQENALSALVDGLKKRPPTIQGGDCRATLNADLYAHWINRDASNRFVAMFEDKSVEVYDLSGTSKTVNYKEETFNSIYNQAAVYTGAKRKIILPTGTTTINLKTTGITTATVIWEQSATGVFGGEETTVRTDTTDTDASVSWTNGYWIRARISAWTAGTITAEVKAKDITYLDVTTPRTDFQVVTVADYTFIINRNYTVEMFETLRAGAVTGSVQLFSDLPATPSTGDLYEVAGDPNTQLDSYYVEYDGSVWRETDKPGIKYAFNPQSMPHLLVHDQATDEFTFQEAAWSERGVGDAATSPEPSFVGRTLNDIFLHKNRLGLLADENCILSGASDFFNFWRGTATAVLDGDVIDVAGSGNKVSVLEHAVPFDEALILFSEQQQFTLTSNNTLTPQSAAITPTTEFEASITAKPVGVGNNVYFALEKGNYTGVREYFVNENDVSKDAAEITAHVPRYIPKDVFLLAGSTTEDVVVAGTLEERNALYVYKYYWGGDGNKKLQSSWSKWTLDPAAIILGAYFIGTKLYLLVQHPADGIWIESINLQSGLVSSGLPVFVHLDRRGQATGTYDAGNDWTTWTIPYDVNVDQTTDGELQALLNANWAGREGELLTITRPTATTFRVAGQDLSAQAAFYGIKYIKRYRFSEQFVKDDKDPPNSIAEGKLQLRRFILKYTQSGNFKVEVTPKARDMNTYVMSGKEVGDLNFKVGDIGVSSGEFVFPVLANSAQVTIDIVNDTFLPSVIQSAEWQGQYSLLSKRGTSTS